MTWNGEERRASSSDFEELKDLTIAGDIGYRTTNNGSANISAGTTSVVVTHGLSVVPR